MKTALITLLIAFTINTVHSTTWGTYEQTCAICNEENDFQGIRSNGNYIYQWDSKFQYIYWPVTDENSIYCCPNCHFTVFMRDFDSIANSKIETVRELLSTILELYSFPHF